MSRVLRPEAVGATPVARRPGPPKLNRRSTGITHSAGTTEGKKVQP